MGTRNGPVKSRKKAEMGTATYDALTFMKATLRNTPGAVEDVKAAAELAKAQCENIGLVSGGLWDEHGVSWLIQLYNTYVQIVEVGPPVEVPVTEPETDIPSGIRDSFPPEGTLEDSTGETPPAPFKTPNTKVLARALAERFTLHDGTRSTQKAIGLWTRKEIMDSVGYKSRAIEGRTFVMNAWITLAGMLPYNDSIVHDFVTEEQLEQLGLRGDDD